MKNDFKAHLLLSKMNKKETISTIYNDGSYFWLRTQYVNNIVETKLNITKNDDEGNYFNTYEFLKNNKKIYLDPIFDFTIPFRNSKLWFMLNKQDVKRLKSFKPLKDVGSNLDYYGVRGDEIFRSDGASILLIKINNYKFNDYHLRMPLYAIEWLDDEAWIQVFVNENNVEYIIEDKLKENRFYIKCNKQKTFHEKFLFKNIDKNSINTIFKTSKAELKELIKLSKDNNRVKIDLGNNLNLNILIAENILKIYTKDEIVIKSLDNKICFIDDEMIFCLMRS